MILMESSLDRANEIKVEVGMVNRSIRHATWRRALEQNEGDPDCIIDQGIEGCRDWLEAGKNWWKMR